LDIIATGGNPMNEDRIAGTAKNVAGQAQEGFGRVTGDVKSQVEGAARQVAGAAQAVRETASDAEDFVRKTIESRPYTTAVVALAIGFLIGRMGRRDYW